MKITIFGLGAIGSNLLVQLAKQFPDYEFEGVDFDKVEERNLRTQAYFIEHVNLHKADAMRVILSRYLRKPKYTPNRGKITDRDKIVVAPGNIGIDCFDNTASRKILSQTKGDLLHIGFSPFYTAECIWNEEYEVPNDVDPRQADICSMHDAVGFIHFVVNAAVLNISHYLAQREKKNFIITGKNRIKWL